MRLCWFNDRRLGLVTDGAVQDVSSVLSLLDVDPYANEGDPVIANLERLKDPIVAAAANASKVPIEGVSLLSPVARPTKIIGVPANYLKHNEEAAADPEITAGRYVGTLREQGLFLKAVSALVGPGEGVSVRFPDRRTDHEMELGIVIGKKGSEIPVDKAFDHIAGYAIALDMVVRGPEDRSFRKSIDTYAVLGPWLVTKDEVQNPQELDFSLSVNGELRQQSNTRFMIMRIAEQIAWASSFYTLWPGDIIMSGTCEGVGKVAPGDRMHCWIDGIASMQVEVR